MAVRLAMVTMVRADGSPLERPTPAGSPSTSSRRRAKDRILTPENLKKVLSREGSISDVNHYARLKVRRESPTPKIVAAYEERVAELQSMEGLDEETRQARLEELEESYEVLTSVRERRIYDWSLLQQLQRQYVWPYQADLTQRYTGGMRQEEEYDEVTKRVGYFFLAWVILSIILLYVLAE